MTIKQLYTADLIGRNPGFTFVDTVIGSETKVEFKDVGLNVVAEGTKLDVNDAYTFIRRQVGILDDVVAVITQDERDALTSTALGQEIFVSDLGQNQIFDGTVWVFVSDALSSNFKNINERDTYFAINFGRLEDNFPITVNQGNAVTTFTWNGGDFPTSYDNQGWEESSLNAGPGSLVLGDDGLKLSSAANNVFIENAYGVGAVPLVVEFDASGSSPLTAPLFGASSLQSITSVFNQVLTAPQTMQFGPNTAGASVTAFQIRPATVGRLRIQAFAGTLETDPVILDERISITVPDITTTLLVTLSNPLIFKIGDENLVKFSNVDMRGGLQTSGDFDTQTVPYIDIDFALVTEESLESTPGGSDTQVQFNNNGSFDGISGITTDGINLDVSGRIDGNGVGGDLTLRAGSNSPVGGEVVVQGGGASTTGGGVRFEGGLGGVNGGPLNFVGGEGPDGSGGSLFFNGGNGGVDDGSGAGGSQTFMGGEGGFDSGNGGDLDFVSGIAHGFGSISGSITLDIGASTGGGPIGDVLIVPTRGSVGIGSATVDNSAILELTSASQGFLPPRMTTAEKLAIPSPATGLEVFDITLNRPEFFEGVWSSGLGGNVSTSDTLTTNFVIIGKGTADIGAATDDDVAGFFTSADGAIVEILAKNNSAIGYTLQKNGGGFVGQFIYDDLNDVTDLFMEGATNNIQATNPLIISTTSGDILTVTGTYTDDTTPLVLFDNTSGTNGATFNLFVGDRASPEFNVTAQAGDLYVTSATTADMYFNVTAGSNNDGWRKVFRDGTNEAEMETGTASFIQYTWFASAGLQPFNQRWNELGTTLTIDYGRVTEVESTVAYTHNATTTYDLNTTGAYTLNAASTATIDMSGGDPLALTGTFTDDADPVITVDNTSGTNGVSVSEFQGTQNPNGVISGSPGDTYTRKDGLDSTRYMHITGTIWRNMAAPAPIYFGATDIGTTITTRFLLPGSGYKTATTTVIENIVPEGLLRNMYIYQNVLGVGSFVVYEIFHNGVGTGISAPVDPTTTLSSNTAFTLGVSAGDTISIAVRKSLAITTSPQDIVVFLEFF